jgi:hypothetical protein
MGPYAVADYTTSTYVDARVDSNIFTIGNPMPGSTLTLCQSRLYPLVRDLGRVTALDDIIINLP